MGAVAARAGRVLPSLLRERRELRRYWSGRTISLFGDQVTLIALPLVAVLALDATPAQMGYLAAAGLLPSLLVAVTPRDRYVEANSLVYGSRAFSFVGGQSLGGLLVQLLSAPGALLA